MKTFIEQKEEIKQQIADLERRNIQLYDELDQNEVKISQLQKVLANIGLPA